MLLEPGGRMRPRIGPAAGVIDGAGTPNEMLEFAFELLEEVGIVLIMCVAVLQFGQRMRQRLRDEGAAIGAEMPARVGKVVAGRLMQRGGRHCLALGVVF